eukprot:CAMPEP_0117666620 /NCGR_PEP_ID=MMETSP0804-20121206/10484_1 /TAXON_ID=1074897 /ORGANISM="Tetraselmis astigmatica, Strain CCMP880" /LENGTH=49 /DNA_ID=CAMNT_0005474199 /DNA_START=1188 /DNA_END=1337 /DNA_ORIENTATION=+
MGMEVLMLGLCGQGMVGSCSGCDRGDVHAALREEASRVQAGFMAASVAP